MNARIFRIAAWLTPLLAVMLGIGAAHGHDASERPALPPLKLPPFKSRVPAAQFQLPPLQPDAGVPAGQTRRVTTVRFRGNRVLDDATLAAIARPYEGRDLTVAEIEDLRRKITRLYVEAGYLNSGAVLDANGNAPETLSFTLIEGRLSAVRLKGLGDLHERYVVSRLVPDEEAPLHVDTLRERFQLLLADPLIARAQARVVPDVTLGRAILDIEVERARPYQLSFFAANSRPASVGEGTLGLAGWLRNLTGWGDSLELALQSGTRGDVLGGRGGSRRTLTWRMPINARGTEISLQADEGQSTVLEEPVADLDIQSRLATFELGVGQRLFENLQQRLSVGLAYNERTNRSTLSGQPFSFVAGEPDGVTRIAGWRFWQEYAHRREHQALVVRSTFLANDTNLQAMAGAPNQANTIWLGQGHYAQRFPANGMQLALKGTSQRTSRRLSPLDRLALGGAQTVRGFRENQLIRDEGGILNLDVDYAMLPGAGEMPLLSAGLFADGGSGRNQGERSARLASAGITLKVRHLGWRFDLAYALAHRTSADLARHGNTLQDKGIHFQLTYDVFGQ